MVYAADVSWDLQSFSGKGKIALRVFQEQYYVRPRKGREIREKYTLKYYNALSVIILYFRRPVEVEK